MVKSNLSEFSVASDSCSLEIKNISKSFGSVKANDLISFKVTKGTIHGIIGENGAGKSTLMSIVYGYYQADSGHIFVNGNKANITSPEKALSYGIGMVHQHFMLVNTFTVLENLILGAESGKVLDKSLKKARKQLEELEKNYSLNVDPEKLISDLPVGIRQRVEILKALYRGADILILDEPTGVLTPQEVEHLFKILKELKKQGKTIILITHKLHEIMTLTDNVTVMRQGKIVKTLPTLNTSKENLAELMIGRPVLLNVKKKESHLGDVLLSVKNINYFDENNIQKLKSISFDIRKGEILGVAGVAGNGQSELLEILSGMKTQSDGELIYNNISFTNNNPTNPVYARNNGIAHVPEDRQQIGLVTSFNAKESAILGYHKNKKYSGKLFFKVKKIFNDILDKMTRFDVRPNDPLLKTSLFSGGNQQKLVLVREIDQNPDLLIVGQPTRGVDIGAIEFIYHQLLSMRSKQKSIILISVELEEILTLADRIIVMFDGEIVGEVKSSDATEKELGLLMAGEKQA
ncbi:ABC transporter ATP-binding protein [Alphaproteobacteria bacterium]|nr:ABC transporter ATP-binding protein [Alphaproteobacteria bacterium]